MDFGQLKIIFGYKIGNFVFFIPFFVHLLLFLGHWRPIESNYGPKYTSDWLS